MISHQIEALFQRSKTTIHLLQLHSLIIKTALHHDEYRFSQFISFSSSISLQFTRTIFRNSPIIPSIFAWNTMMRAYSISSAKVKSLTLFNQFQEIGLKPDKFTFPVVLKVCGHCLMIGTGGSLHSMAVKSGFGSDLHVNNTLLRMYAGFGVIRFARLVFDEMLERDIVSWSSMMAAYVHWYAYLFNGQKHISTITFCCKFHSTTISCHIFLLELYIAINVLKHTSKLIKSSVSCSLFLCKLLLSSQLSVVIVQVGKEIN